MSGRIKYWCAIILLSAIYCATGSIYVSELIGEKKVDRKGHSAERQDFFFEHWAT